MDYTIDGQLLRERLSSMTMEAAHMGGSDDPHELVVDYFGSGRFSFDPSGDGGLDDALRLAAAVLPFGPGAKLDYRWAGPANDEGHEVIVFQIAEGQLSSGYPYGRFVEVALAQLAAFGGGSVIQAVEFVVRAAAEAFMVSDS